MLNKKVLLIALGLGLVIVAFCAAWNKEKSRMQADYMPLSVVSYRDAAYTIEGVPVTLVDGHVETETAPGSSTKITTVYFGNDVVGDLNNDGRADVIFLLTQDGGGSGIFYYAVAALGALDGYHGTNAIFLGDRIAPQAMELHDNVAVVNYVDRKAGEPMTAIPSIGIFKYLQVSGGELIEVGSY
jgi:hypothetical protein